MSKNVLKKIDGSIAIRRRYLESSPDAAMPQWLTQLDEPTEGELLAAQLEARALFQQHWERAK